MAYLSGRRSTNSQQFGAYSQDDIDSLRALVEEPGIVDIFLTYPSYKLNIVNGLCLHLCCVPFDHLYWSLCNLYLVHFLYCISLMNGRVGSQIELPHLVFYLER